MTWTPPVLGPNGWEVQPITSSASFTITKTTAANLPAASVLNIGSAYTLTDVGNKTVYNFDGVSWEDITPPLDAAASAFQAVLWANRGTGDYVGHIKRISNLGNNANVLAIWDGTYWQPLGGRQPIYELKEPITGGPGTSSVVTLPSVTIPGGLMGLNGGFEIKLHTHTLSSVVTVANTISYTYGGFELFGTDNGTSRRLWMGREVMNRNATNVQTVMSNASGSGAYIVTTNDPKETTKDSTVDQALAGTATATHASSVTNRCDQFNVYWLGG